MVDMKHNVIQREIDEQIHFDHLRACRTDYYIGLVCALLFIFWIVAIGVGVVR